MDWTWSLRSGDGGMAGLEFARCRTAGGLRRVLVHAAPAQLELEVRDSADGLVARGSAVREGERLPMTLLTLDGGEVRREEVWPDGSLHGLPVLLCGGEVGVLQAWQHAPDHSWWRWSVEFSNTTQDVEDWAPPGQDVQR